MMGKSTCCLPASIGLLRPHNMLSSEGYILPAPRRNDAPLQEGMRKTRSSSTTATPEAARNMSDLDTAARPSPMRSLDLCP